MILFSDALLKNRGPQRYAINGKLFRIRNNTTILQKPYCIH